MNCPLNPPLNWTYRLAYFELTVAVMRKLNFRRDLEAFHFGWVDWRACKFVITHLHNYSNLSRVQMRKTEQLIK